MKKMSIKYYFLLLLIITFSCETNMEDRIAIKGYSIGDKIGSEITIQNKNYDLPYSNAQSNKDQRITFRIKDSIIVTIVFSGMKEKEYYSLVKELNNTKYGFSSKKELPGNLKLKGEIKYWINEQTKDEIILSNIVTGENNIYDVVLFNDELSDSLMNSSSNDDCDEEYPMSNF